jgi:peptide-methionine (S)-S-oxide reductase
MIKEIILSGTCFWCLEAIFQKVKGIEEVKSGYYSLNHYEFKFMQDDKLEAVRLAYNDEILSTNTLLDIFYQIHIPTLNSWKKEDCFSYYCRSSIIVNDEQTLQIAEQKIKEVIDSKIFEGDVQTKIIKFIPGAFSLAKEKDQDYYNKNPSDGFCTSQIIPKFDKVGNKFPSYFKK